MTDDPREMTVPIYTSRPLEAEDVELLKMAWTGKLAHSWLGMWYWAERPAAENWRPPDADRVRRLLEAGLIAVVGGDVLGVFARTTTFGFAVIQGWEREQEGAR